MVKTLKIVWDKGKKRDKNHQRLLDVKYPSKQKLSSTDFSPKSHRHVKVIHVNTLLKNLQTVFQNSKDTSMLEIQLEMSYRDYELGDKDISQLMGRALHIESNITPLMLNVTTEICHR